MIESIVIQFRKFPGAETVHLLQGAVAGFLMVNGYIHQSVARVLIAFVIMTGFAIYEICERWRIGDEADIDFAVFLVTMWASMMITLAVYLIRLCRQPPKDRHKPPENDPDS